MKKARVLLAMSLSWIALAPAGARADHPADRLGKIPAPGPTGTGLTRAGGLLWVADHGLDELLAVEPGSGKVVRRLKSPGYRPGGLAFDGRQLWNVDVLQARLYRIRPGDGLVTRTVPSPVAVPRALAWDGRALWVSDDASKAIHRVDPLDGTTISEIPFPGRSVDGLTWDGRYLWVADRLADRLYAVDTRHGEVVVIFNAPGPHASGLAFADGRLQVLDYQDDDIVSLRRDGTDPVLLLGRQNQRVIFTHQVRNFGPDPLARLEVLLAVPRDLPSQKLLEPARFSPAPGSIVSDRWGQRVARFVFENVAAGSTTTVRLSARVQARALRWVVWPERVGPLAKIPRPVRRRYLVDEPKYDIGNPVIQQAVQQALAGERNPYWMTRAIYRYIHSKMHYQMIGGWDVAPKVLARGSGSCSEYSYVMIAMCRAAGLPARYVGSLVVRRDRASWDDVFHRWVEIYLPGYGWIPVDPSRGDKPSQAERADAFGGLEDDFLVTTIGGGASEWLDWNYNYNERYTCRGRCRVEVEPIAEWEPDGPGAGGR